MYEDFDDLRENCPAEYQMEIAIDLHHGDSARLDAIWKVTGDGEFRLGLTRQITDFWEGAVRERGEVEVDLLAMEILLDSYHDAEMGHSLYLEMHAYCGTGDVGDLCWQVFDDEALTVRFEKEAAPKIIELIGRREAVAGLRCTVEVEEVREL